MTRSRHSMGPPRVPVAGCAANGKGMGKGRRPEGSWGVVGDPVRHSSAAIKGRKPQGPPLTAENPLPRADFPVEADCPLGWPVHEA